MGINAFTRAKSIDIYAKSSYDAQEKAAVTFKAKKSYQVTVCLCEKDDKEVTHDTMF